MKIKTPATVSNLETLEDLQRYSSQFFDAIVPAINGGISFQDNIDATTLDVAFAAANSEVGTQHKLGRVPTGYIVVKRSSSATIFDGTGANTAETIYLKSTAAAKIKVVIF